MQSIENSPPGLSLEGFHELLELVRRRHEDPEALNRLRTDPQWARAWAAYQASVERDVKDVNDGLRFSKPEDYGRRPFARTLKGRWSRFHPQASSQGATFTAELAIVLGEISRLSRLEPDALAREKLGETELDPQVAAHLGAAAHLQATYPLLAAASDVLLRHGRPELKPGQEGLPIEMLLELVADLQRLQEKLGSKENVVVRKNLGGTVSHLGRALAARSLLAVENFPESFERAYEGHWHTAAKTKTATGAFVDVVRERTRYEGSPGLLITLAASSDGRNRRIAGFSDNTPEAVYDKLVYDNSLSVLYAVVESKHFTQYKAAAMVDTGLAKQIIAVMLNSRARTSTGRIDTQIRYTACERAIAHEGVDPLYVYQFLHEHAHNEDFPTYLWPDFVKELARRYAMVQMHGEPKVQSHYKDRLSRFSTLFLEEELKPYWEARRKVNQGQANSGTPWVRRQALEAQEYLDKHEHLKDPALWAILVEGCTSGAQLVEMLRYTKESDLPISKELMVKVLTNSDSQVREQGMALLPNIRPQDIETAQQEIDARVAQNREHLRDKVFNSVIPDYEPIEGEPRLLSRMHHFFLAAKEIEAPELESIFIRCAEQDPRTIPERFQEITEMRRTARSLMSTVDLATQDAERVATARHFSSSVEQGGLFHPGELPAGDSQGTRPAETGAERKPREEPIPSPAQQPDLFGGLASAGVSGTVRQPHKSPLPTSR